MRKLTLGISTALLCCGAGIALAQVTTTMRPAPTVSPKAMQAAAGTDVYQAQIQALNEKVNGLASQLASAKTEIAALRRDLGTSNNAIAGRVPALNTRVSKLNDDYQSHIHFYDQGNSYNGTSPPSRNCHDKANPSTTDKRFSGRYDCYPPQ